jgi:hypothetical protein
MPAIARRDPRCMRIRTRRPIAFPKAILPAGRFVESVDPDITGTRHRRPDYANVRRAWRCTQVNANTHADGRRGENTSTCEQQKSQQFWLHSSLLVRETAIGKAGVRISSSVNDAIDLQTRRSARARHLSFSVSRKADEADALRLRPAELFRHATKLVAAGSCSGEFRGPRPVPRN